MSACFTFTYTKADWFDYYYYYHYNYYHQHNSHHHFLSFVAGSRKPIYRTTWCWPSMQIYTNRDANIANLQVCTKMYKYKYFFPSPQSGYVGSLYTKFSHCVTIYTDFIFADLFSFILSWIHFHALVKSRTSLAILEVADLSFRSFPRAGSAFLQGPPHHNHSVVFWQKSSVQHNMYKYEDLVRVVKHNKVQLDMKEYKF